MADGSVKLVERPNKDEKNKSVPISTVFLFVIVMTANGYD